MSDEPDKGVTPEPEVLETPEAVKEEVFDEAGYKALVAKLRETEKQAKKDAARLIALEKESQTRIDAEKTELQKAQDRADKLEADLKKEQLKVMRRDAATEAKLPLAWADRLKGETPEELLADALILLETMPAKVAPKIDPTNPGGIQTGETEAQKRARLLG